MDHEIEKRISDAIEDGTEAPHGELARALESDPEAARYFDELKRVEAGLRSWAHEEPPREYWRGFVPLLIGRLDGPISATDVSPLDPPAPDDEPEPEPEPEPPTEEDGLAALAGLVGRATVPPVAAFDDDRRGGGGDAVIDLKAIRESEAPPPFGEKAGSLAGGARAPAASTPGGEGGALSVSPLMAAERVREQPKTLYFVVGFLVLALAVVGYLALRNGDREPETQLASASAPGSGLDAPRADPGREERSIERAGETEPALATAEPVEDEGQDDGNEAVGVGEEAGSASTVRRATGAKATGGASRPAAGAGAATPQPPAPTKAAATEAPAPGTKAVEAAPTGSASLDALLSGATKAAARPSGGGSDTVTAVVATSGEGDEVSDQPSRSQVRRAMGSVAGQVYACRSMVESSVRVNATVTVGSNGTVQTASVAGGSPEVNACVERAVRGARFPTFRQPTFTVTYPFVLSPPE